MALAVGVASGGAQAVGVAEFIIGLREVGSACVPRPGLAPLTPRSALDRAAASLADGTPLADGLKSSGYRFATAKVISVSGSADSASLEATISSRFCPAITDAKLVDIGVYQRGADTWVVLAAPFAPDVEVGEADIPTRLLTLVNKARSEPRRCGGQAFGAAPPLKWNETLMRVARAHSEDMARQNYFSHDGRDGSEPAGRVARAGYKYRAMGENIAAGQTTAEGAVAGWVRSPPHCANLMNRVFTDMGVAFATNAKSDMGVYWTQVFGTPLN